MAAVLAGTLFSARAQEHGTAFALLRTPEAIYVAADSKLSWFDTTGVPGSTCKIRRVGSTWYVMGGIYQFTRTGYNAPALARAALGGSRPVAQKVMDFESRITPQIQKMLEFLIEEKAQTDNWEEVVAIPLTIFVFSFENGGPEVSSREFARATTGGGGPTVRIQRRDFQPNSNETVWLASPSNLAGGFMTEVPTWQSMEPSAMVRAFVEFAARKRPGTTGGSIDILRIDRTGHRWLRRKTDCMD
jgi:hypothetical protein